MISTLISLIHRMTPNVNKTHTHVESVLDVLNSIIDTTNKREISYQLSTAGHPSVCFPCLHPIPNTIDCIFAVCFNNQSPLLSLYFLVLVLLLKKLFLNGLDGEKSCIELSPLVGKGSKGERNG